MLRVYLMEPGRRYSAVRQTKDKFDLPKLIDLRAGR